MSKYEVRTYTLCDNWVNCWSCGELLDEPLTYETIEDAQAAIDEYISDMAESYASGDMGDGEDFDEAGEREQVGIYCIATGAPCDTDSPVSGQLEATEITANKVESTI